VYSARKEKPSFEISRPSWITFADQHKISEAEKERLNLIFLC
jgi:hypothetical protein